MCVPQGPAALRSSTFQGCLGEASLDERDIGLWNYVSREGECGGCFSRYSSKVTGSRPARTQSHVRVSPQAEETSFHFDGSGFSLVHKSLRTTSTSVVLLFKTLSPGGLLLYLASNNTVATHTRALRSLRQPHLHLSVLSEGLPVHRAGGGAGSSDLRPRLRGPGPDLQQEVQHRHLVQGHAAEEQTQR